MCSLIAESFDEQIARRNIGFRLVVVVVRDEILDRIFRKEPRNSEYNCAASVLFGARISAGRLVAR